MPDASAHPDRWSLPHAVRGQSVGLLGGSFDPPHPGHAHITLEALKRFGLDRIWWLVSPGNPLKQAGPAALSRRLAAARAIMQHPRVEVSDLETRLGTRFTSRTLGRLLPLYPGVRFVWLMGADNLAEFHQWGQWHRIVATVPIGVLARPGERISARTSPMAAIYRHARLKGHEARLLARTDAPAWCFANVPMVNISSSSIRADGTWAR